MKNTAETDNENIRIRDILNARTNEKKYIILFIIIIYHEIAHLSIKHVKQ